MSHSDLIAIEKFATELKKDFPIIEHPRSYKDEFHNVTSKHARAMIDIELDHAREAFSEQAEKEAQANGK